MKLRRFQKGTRGVERYKEWAQRVLPILGLVVEFLPTPPPMVVSIIVVAASQRAPDSDGEEAGCINNIDLLIDEVREREPLWNMGDRRHADSVVTRRLWEEVCREVVTGWEDLNPRAQNRAREKVQNRWRSIRDRFKKELNKEMLAPSGSGGRVSRYKYFRVLAILRTTMACRSTVCSTREPASNPPEAIPTQSATGEHLDRPHPSAPSLSSGPSVPSTSAGVSGEASLHEAADMTKLWRTTHALITSSTVSVFRLMAVNKTRHLAVRIPKEHSTIRRALDNR
ncbi:uncharacterized protein ACNLHF_022797 [Anomaloglossus baeobatrachus]